MRLFSIVALLGLALGCASSRDHQDDSATEPHFAAHEGRPTTGHHTHGGGSSGSGGQEGDSLLDSILGGVFGVLFSSDDDS